MIEMKNISKSFGELQVLNNFSLKIENEGVTVLWGKSGSGKTTAINILLNLINADSGEVIVKNEVKFGVVFQEDRLLNGFSAKKNLDIFCLDANVWLEKFDLTDSAHKLAKNLSGGQKRRLCLARSMCINPDILILDEPFKGLDEAAKQNAMNIVLEFSKIKPVILISHDEDDVKFFNASLLDLTKISANK